MARSDWTVSGTGYLLNTTEYVTAPHSIKMQSAAYLYSVVSTYGMPYGIIGYVLRGHDAFYFGRKIGSLNGEFSFYEVSPNVPRIQWAENPSTPYISIDHNKYLDLGSQGQWLKIWVSTWNSGDDRMARVRQYDFGLSAWEIRGTFPVWAGAKLTSQGPIYLQPIGAYIDDVEILQATP